MSDDPGNTGAGTPEEPGDYCRGVETYLCRKNDGHLIRITGPAFTRVCGWATRGIPLNIVYRGIDRYFERYYARGPRRRPVQIDFCEDDVLDAFDDWRRAVGLWVGDTEEASGGRRPSTRDPNSGCLGPRETGHGEPAATEVTPVEVAPIAPVSVAAHVERVIVRLTTLRAGGRLSGDADRAVASAIRELDRLRAAAREDAVTARESCTSRLRVIDEQLIDRLRESLDAKTRHQFDSEAQREIAPFKGAMAEDAYRRAMEAIATRLVRERFGLPNCQF